jgi:hypothetical protein
MPKSSKPVDPPAEEEFAEQEAAKKKIKKKRKAEPEPEPEPEEEEEEEEEAEEEVEVDAAKAKKAKAAKKARKKAAGYRRVAHKAGYEKSSSPAAAGGRDISGCTISLSDAKRLASYTPHDFSKGTFDKAEAETRLELSKESVPLSAAKIIQLRCEAVARNVLNESLMRLVESGRRTLDASTVLSVLRPYEAAMMFTAVKPAAGLVRFAQESGVLATTPSDEEHSNERDKDNKELTKIFKAMKKEREAVRASRSRKGPKPEAAVA